MKTNKILSLILLSFIGFFTACLNNDDNNGNELTLTYTFDGSDNGWTGGFADYSVGRENDFNLDFSVAPLPAPLDTSRKVIRISGTNLSDNLFMFTKTQIGGLYPNTTYELTYHVELAYDAPENSAGIGGSPGASNYLKVGASATEPMKVANEGFYNFNLDKGGQSQGGKDAVVIGNIGHEGDQFEYQYIERNNGDMPVTAKTDQYGNLWLFVGVDSGFEGTTTFYITQIQVTIK